MKFIMNFLRSPFQFRSSDQPNRKVESDSSDSPIVENMFIDPTTGLTTDPRWRAASPGIGASSSSPRLQHRVPGFENNGSRPVEIIHEPSMPRSASNENSEKPQRVRVVPIKVESVDDSGSPKKRSSAFHSSSGSIPRSSQFGPLQHPNFDDLNSRKRHSSGPAVHKRSDANEPKVCNIPIFVQGRDTPFVPKTSQSSQNVAGYNIPSPKMQPETAKQNGGNLTKGSTKCKQDTKLNVCDISLKQISDTVSELQAFKKAVNEFKGAPQDKQYRYLDEMLTRCMLKLDDVETHGDEAVRASRKAAIKAVQECITELESRAQTNTKLKQTSEMSGETGENNDRSDVADSKKEEIDVPKAEADLSVCENIQDATEAGDKAEGSGNSCIENVQSSATKDTEDIQQRPLCLEGMDSVTSSAECAEMTVLEEAGDIVNMPTEMKESEADTNEFEKLEQKAQVQDQPVNMEEEFKNCSEGLGDVANNVMDSVEVTDIPSLSVGPGDLPKQTEPMDSDEVPDEPKIDSEMVEAEDEVVDSEMVELAKETVSAESNKDTSVSLQINE